MSPVGLSRYVLISTIANMKKDQDSLGQCEIWSGQRVNINRYLAAKVGDQPSGDFVPLIGGARLTHHGVA